MEARRIANRRCGGIVAVAGLAVIDEDDLEEGSSPRLRTPGGEVVIEGDEGTGEGEEDEPEEAGVGAEGGGEEGWGGGRLGGI